MNIYYAIRNKSAFTLIELIIVISVISLLAAIIIVALNPTKVFITSRNNQRQSDIGSTQLALSNYFAGSDANSTTPRTFDDFPGLNSLYASAQASPAFGNCPGGSQGNSLSLSNSYILDNSGNPNTINLQPLINKGYLPKILADPTAKTGYNACIDTSNNNLMVIFSGNNEGSTTPTYTAIKPISPVTLPSLGTGTSGGGGGGGGTGTTSTSYNCPTGSSYSNANCSTTYTSSVLGTTGRAPYGITIDSSGNIYTANQLSNNVTKITPAGVSSIIGTTDSYPTGITVDSFGNVYTSNRTSSDVSKITSGGVSSILGTTGYNPYGITIDSSGNIYTSNTTSNNVTKITPAGVSSIFATTGSNPAGITIDSSGNIYTANNNSSSNISKITPAGVSSIFATTGGYPDGITIDSSGNLYTSNTTSNNVTKITPAGVSSIIGTTGSTPHFITIDSSGNIYTANFSTNDVSKITPAGMSSIIGNTGSSPYGITIDSIGNIYTDSQSADNVKKLTANPNAILSISPSTIKVGQSYTLGLNNVINSGVRVNSGTCSIQVSDVNVPASPVVLQTNTGNMSNGACQPGSYTAVTNTHPLSIQATISSSSQVFTYTTTPQ